MLISPWTSLWSLISINQWCVLTDRCSKFNDTVCDMTFWSCQYQESIFLHFLVIKRSTWIENTEMWFSRFHSWKKIKKSIYVSKTYDTLNSRYRAIFAWRQTQAFVILAAKVDWLLRNKMHLKIWHSCFLFWCLEPWNTFNDEHVLGTVLTRF